MFSKDSGENFEKFANGAWLALAVSNLSGIVLINIIIFPLILLLPITIIAGLWYSKEYLKRFIFRFDDTHFFVRKGVILYSYTLIPYENIQDVHVIQGLVERLFGVWSVIIFTATTSSRGAETVPGLSREGAERLKETIFKKIKEAKHVTD